LLGACLVLWGCGVRPEEELALPVPLPPPPDWSLATVERPASCAPGPIVEHGPRERMRVALTFDACSTGRNEYDERITRILRKTETPATFFLGGVWSERGPERVRDLAADPLFELANHTHTHPHMPKVKEDARVLQELLLTQRTVFELTGRLPRYFRPPFGEVNARVAALAARVGLVTIQYDLPSGDPDENATSRRLVNWVLGQARPGSIVVMHVNHPHFATAEALPEIIRGLRSRGYELVTVGTLLEDRSEPTCREPPEEDLSGAVVSRISAR
jgi:peptidoglycan-N-acetylglucosamine deacetylase